MSIAPTALRVRAEQASSGALELELRGADLHVAPERMLGRSVGAMHEASGEHDPATEKGGCVVEDHQIHVVLVQCRDQLRRQPDARLKASIGIGAELAVEEHAHVDVAFAVGPALGVAPEEECRNDLRVLREAGADRAKADRVAPR